MRLARQEALAQLINGWDLILVLTLANLILADGLVWSVIAPGWPHAGDTMP